MAVIDLTLQLLVLIYIIFYVFLVLQRYNVKGTSEGYIFYKIYGKGYTENDGVYTPWDQGDLVYPEQDSNGVFLGYTLYEITGQTMDYCTTPCDVDDDCVDSTPYQNPVCNDNGFCEGLT